MNTEYILFLSKVIVWEIQHTSCSVKTGQQGPDWTGSLLFITKNHWILQIVSTQHYRSWSDRVGGSTGLSLCFHMPWRPFSHDAAHITLGIRGDNSVKLFFSPLLESGLLSNFLPLRRIWCLAKQTGDHKSCLLCKKWQKLYQENAVPWRCKIYEQEFYGILSWSSIEIHTVNLLIQAAYDEYEKQVQQKHLSMKL